MFACEERRAKLSREEVLQMYRKVWPLSNLP